MRAEQYPLTMVKHNHGNLIAHSATRSGSISGWAGAGLWHLSHVA
jgi:hypothetical protein